jgi:hypothetical protein
MARRKCGKAMPEEKLNEDEGKEGGGRKNIRKDDDEEVG